MRLYIKQHIFTWGDKFSIYDEDGNEKYYVEGEVFSFGKKLHLYDNSCREIAYIEQKLLTFLPKYRIYRGDEEFAEVVKEFTFFHPEYTVTIPSLNAEWQVHGEFFNHDYEIVDGDRVLVSVSKEWFTLGDAYRISIDAGVDEASVLAVVLVIDACIEAQRNN